MAEARIELEASGVTVVAVGGSADYQARDLLDHGCPFTLLLDPDQLVRNAVDVGRLTWRQMVSVEGARNYIRAFRRARPGAIGREEAMLAPGVVITDRELSVRWVHRGTAVGDYPDVARVIDAVDRLA